jgi:RecA-family ATPase
MSDQENQQENQGKVPDTMLSHSDPAIIEAARSYIMDRLERLNRIERERHGVPGESIVTSLADIEEMPVRWFWSGRIPYGKLTIVDGDPGVGKSMFMCHIAALASIGKPLPGESEQREPNQILFLSEDPPEDTIKPRIRVMGGDMQRVMVHRGVLVKQGCISK